MPATPNRTELLNQAADYTRLARAVAAVMADLRSDEVQARARDIVIECTQTAHSIDRRVSVGAPLSRAGRALADAFAATADEVLR